MFGSEGRKKGEHQLGNNPGLHKTGNYYDIYYYHLYSNFPLPSRNYTYIRKIVNSLDNKSQQPSSKQVKYRGLYHSFHIQCIFVSILFPLCLYMLSIHFIIYIVFVLAILLNIYIYISYGNLNFEYCLSYISIFVSLGTAARGVCLI